MDNQPKPSLKSDAKYLKKVAGTIKKSELLETLELDNLNNALKSFGINDDPYNLVSLEDLNPESLKTLITSSFKKINDSEPNENQLNQLYKL